MSVQEIFAQVKDYFGFDQYKTNSAIFSLNTKATVAIFVSFSLIVTAQQFIGDPIDCIVEEVPSGIFLNIFQLSADKL